MSGFQKHRNGSKQTVKLSKQEGLEDLTTRSSAGLSFSGHETFTLRHGWLKKAVEAVQKNPHIFARDSAMVELGVGKNMVRSIRHWALATEVVREVAGTRGAELCVSEFGASLFGSQGYDPFLEDLNTLWLIQWKLAAKERRSTGWHWIFNYVRSNEFTRQSLFELFVTELEKRGTSGLSESSLRRDIDCAIRTYVGTRKAGELLEESLECPLVELELVRSDSEGILLRFNRGPKQSLADLIFLYALLEFWDARGASDSLAFSDVAFGEGSPGSVFKLDENSIASSLERLADVTDGCLIYDETAGLRQVYRRKKIGKHSVLKQHYEGVALAAGE